MHSFRRLVTNATIGICVLMFAGTTPGETQDCQAILNQLLNGQPGYGSPQMAQELADQYNNCRGGQTQQPSYQPPAENLFDNAVTRELSALSTMLVRGQPLRENIPLSSGTVMMQNTLAPPPAAPTNYVDPFAARTFPPITESAAGPVKKYGSVWDPSQWVSISPPAQTPPAAQTPTMQSGPCGPYAAQTGVCRGPVTGFQQ